MISASGLFLLNLIEGHLLKFHNLQPGICTVQTQKNGTDKVFIIRRPGWGPETSAVHAIWQSFDMRQKIELLLAHKTIPGKW